MVRALPKGSIPVSPNPKLIQANPTLWHHSFFDHRLSVVPCLGYTPRSWVARVRRAFISGPRSDRGFCGALVRSAKRVSGIVGTRIPLRNMTFYRNKPGGNNGAVTL